MCFRVNPTGSGGQKLAVVALDGQVERGRALVDTVLGHPLVAGTWQEVAVPLASLGASTGTLRDLYIQDWSGVDQPAVFIDDVSLSS